jgi:hypothetical protein
MHTVLIVMACIFALAVAPAAFILGMIGFWILGTFGAVVGVLIGLGMQAS